MSKLAIRGLNGPRRGANLECPDCHLAFICRWNGQKYCSTVCARSNSRIERSLDCACGKTFIARRPRQRFCSRTCGSTFSRPTDAKNCVGCGSPFRSGSWNQRFCSRRCNRKWRAAHNLRACQRCGVEFGTIDIRQRFCSKQCGRVGRRHPAGADVYNWRGGRTTNNGYVRARSPGHPRTTKKNPYVLEHILVMERSIGRYLLRHERVHHRNGRRADNRIENLELWHMKDPPGVRASDYHCPGCRCAGRQTLNSTFITSPSAI